MYYRRQLILHNPRPPLLYSLPVRDSHKEERERIVLLCRLSLVLTPSAVQSLMVSFVPSILMVSIVHQYQMYFCLTTKKGMSVYYAS